MKLLHLSDLHLGKRLHQQELYDDQAHVLDQVVDACRQQAVDAVLLAGDIYDRTTPPTAAVELLDAFFTRLAQLGVAVCAIAGNHDCGERLDYGNRFFAARNVHICGRYTGALQRVTLADEHGEVDIHLLPFVKPALLRPYFAEGAPALASYDQAVAAILEAASIDPCRRNVLVAHQFVTAAGQALQRSDSETLSVGGLDNVDAAHFAAFDYVALGHIHRGQRVGKESIRYAGCPLPYSLGEWRQQKGGLLVTLGQKGAVDIAHLPLAPLHPLRQLRGRLQQLLDAAPPQGSSDYIHAILTDPQPVLDAIGKLRAVYPNTLHLEWDAPCDPSSEQTGATAQAVATRTPLDLFEDFFAYVNGTPPTQLQRQVVRDIFADLEEQA